MVEEPGPIHWEGENCQGSCFLFNGGKLNIFLMGAALSSSSPTFKCQREGIMHTADAIIFLGKKLLLS